MGTTNRNASWKYEDAKPIMARAPVATVAIARGDLVGLATGTITGATSGASITVGTPYPASDQPWDTNIATTQAAFQDKFLGVAQSQVAAQTPAPRVSTGGVHEFDCASATFVVGALVGPAKQSGNLLEDQKVVAVASEGLAIGRVAVDYSSATTKVLVRVFSTVMEGGVQTPI
jgi:hypothetical protein